uniref:Secreted protein n=1 Tax=Achlya hypogyna TaxID=1202772 RepID=A0A0A7CM62_ACHHY|nr:secreted protein [Achlya hypogyna]
MMNLWCILGALVAAVSAELCVVEPASYAAVTDSSLASAIATLKQNPIGTWINDDGSNHVPGILSQCAGATPVFVIYGLPNKDCSGGYSNRGTNKNADDYRNWIQNIVTTVGSADVIYIVEPDAVGLISQGTCAIDNGYEANVATAVKLLSTNANAQIYVDLAAWAEQPKAVSVLKALQSAGRVKGVSINTSNYHSTAEMVTLCNSYSAALGGAHCIIDTSRNFNGSPQNEWCNARSAGIGAPPTSDTGNSLVDYFLWLKVPGESDGICNDGGRTSDAMVGPPAGQFFAKQLANLWDQGFYVVQKDWCRTTTVRTKSPAKSSAVRDA